MVIAVVSVFGKKKAHKQKALRAKVTGAATNIYADTDASKPVNQIKEEFMNKPNIVPEEVPWVAIGNEAKACLYTSITQTGDESWKPVVEKAYVPNSHSFESSRSSIFNIYVDIE